MQVQNNTVGLEAGLFRPHNQQVLAEEGRATEHLTVKTDDETMAMEIFPKTETATEHLTVKAHDQSRTQQTRTKTRLQKSHTSKQQKGKGGKRQNQKRTNRGHTIHQQRPLSRSNLSTMTGLRSSRRHRRQRQSMTWTFQNSRRTNRQKRVREK
jgi:hypothetical protein